MPDGSPPELKTQFNALLTPVLLNAALVAIKTRDARLALSLTTRALGLSPPISNTDQGKSSPSPSLSVHATNLVEMPTGKAYYRRALAHVALNDEEEAEKDLLEAAKIVPGDEAVRTELTKVQAKKKEKRDREKKAFKGLFA